MATLLLSIFGPQLAGLAAYAALRAALRRRDPTVAQLAAILITAASAGWIAVASFGSVPRIGAFIALEIFVALLAQLLVVAAAGE